MRPIQVTVGPLAAASANAIALSQSAAGAAQLVLNGATASGGVAKLDKPRQVLITSAGNDSGITFTVTGTTFAGAAVSETLAGGNIGAVATQTDFATVTGIRTSGATASTVTVGTNGVAGSAWVRLDEWTVGGTFIQCIASGTVNYTIQQTADDPNSPFYPIAIPNVNWIATNDTGVVNATASADSNYIVTPTYARVVLNSGTGSVTVTFTQTGVANR
jgi:hypothetical protein